MIIMELDEFLEKDIINFLDARIENKDRSVVDREEEYGLYLNKDYLKELDAALDNDELTRAKKLFDELKDNYNKLPKTSLERKKIYTVLEKMYAKIEAYVDMKDRSRSDTVTHVIIEKAPARQSRASNMQVLENTNYMTQDIASAVNNLGEKVSTVEREVLSLKSSFDEPKISEPRPVTSKSIPLQSVPLHSINRELPFENRPFVENKILEPTINPKPIINISKALEIADYENEQDRHDKGSREIDLSESTRISPMPQLTKLTPQNIQAPEIPQPAKRELEISQHEVSNRPKIYRIPIKELVPEKNTKDTKDTKDTIPQIKIMPKINAISDIKPMMTPTPIKQWIENIPNDKSRAASQQKIPVSIPFSKMQKSQLSKTQIPKIQKSGVPILKTSKIHLDDAPKESMTSDAITPEDPFILKYNLMKMTHHKLDELYEEGIYQMYQSNYVEASKIFEKIIELKPKNKAAKIRWLECLEVMENA
jgi:tetratricopeptide (TPR) repeat protein